MAAIGAGNLGIGLSKKKGNSYTVAGSVILGITALCAITTLFCLCVLKKNSEKASKNNDKPQPTESSLLLASSERMELFIPPPTESSLLLTSSEEVQFG
jgi:hypothetical protein